MENYTTEEQLGVLPEFKKDKTKVFIDLSKLSGEEINETSIIIKALINYNINAPFLIFDEDRFKTCNVHYASSNKLTEIDLSEFRQLFSDKGEEVLQVENNDFDREYILCASLKFYDNIVSGHRHSDCYELIRKMCPNIADTSLPQREDQGFLTSLNRHVDRKEGWKIAKENNQIKYGLTASENSDDSQLISENLY